MADFWESHAAKVVSRLAGWNLDAFDPGGGSEQRPDFAICVDGVRAGYLEVTTRLDRRRKGFPSARTRHEFRIPGSKFNWWIVVAVRTSVKSLRTPIIEAIAVMEARGGQTGFQVQHPANHPYFPNGLTEVANEKLHQAGVLFVWAVDPVNPGDAGQVHIEQEGVGIFGASITDELNQELSKRDNIAKMKYALDDGGLGKKPLSEMFVWFDGTPAAVQLRGALSTPGHPSANPQGAPSVPSGVTGVWMATLPIDDPPFAMVVWRHTPQEGWQLVGSVSTEQAIGSPKALPGDPGSSGFSP